MYQRFQSYRRILPELGKCKYKLYNTQLMYGRDTFTGAYASEYVRQMHVNKDLNDDNWDIEAAVVHACRAAALTFATLGAQEGIPWADEIEDFKVRQDAVKAAGTITSVEEHTKEVEDRTRN